MHDKPLWDDDSWQPLPKLHGDLVADVCVVGLGGAGLSAVHAALDRGLRVVGMDADVVAGNASGCNAGFLLAGLASFHHTASRELGRDRALGLYRLTLLELERLSAVYPDLVERRGSLRIAFDDFELADCQAQYVAMTRDELPVSTYRGDEGEGLLFPHDGCYQPMALARREARQALARGARLFEHSQALSIIKGEVITRSGGVRAPTIVVCIDGGLDALLPDLRGRIRTARLQMLATAPTREIDLPRPVYARNGYDYWQQCADGSIVLGGCRDLGGREEWTTNRVTTPAIQNALDDLLRNRLGVRAEVVRRWAANVGFHDGTLPLLERMHSGAVACGAYNGTGNLIGRIYGRQALAMALNEMVEPILLG